MTTERSVAAPLAAGMALGLGFVVMFAVLPIPGYGLLPERVFPRQNADYTPLLQLRIQELRDSYKVGEGIDFSVRQVAGGGCVLPELIMIKDLSTGKIVREWNGTSANFSLFCRVMTNPATYGVTWTARTAEEKPLVLDQTGRYAVVATHLFMTVQKEFEVVAVDDGNDTSQEVVEILLSKSRESETVKALLQKYPDAKATATANFRSDLFSEFAKYNPNGIVQYSIANTDSDRGRTLTLSLIFDRYYDNRNSMPLIHLACTSEGFRSISVGESYVPPSEIENC